MKVKGNITTSPNQKKTNTNESINTTFETTTRVLNPYDFLTTQLKQVNTSCNVTIRQSTMNNGSSNQDYFHQCINEGLESIEGIYYYLSPDEKIDSFAKIAKDCKHKTTIRFGALILLYLLLSKYSSNKTLDISMICIDLLKKYDQFNESFLICCFDILILLKENEFLGENINLICLFLTDSNYALLQQSAFNCLFSIGYKGLKTLIEIATNYPQYQEFILMKLINTPHIQHIVIVKALINELYSKDLARVHSSLGALNRLYDIVTKEDRIELKIAGLLNDSKVNKLSVTSTLRTSGELGEQILIGMAKNHIDFSVRIASCKALAYRLPKHPHYLNIKLSFDKRRQNEREYFFNYHGVDKPIISSSMSDMSNSEGDYLEVYHMEFLAALNRMIGLDYNYDNPQLFFKENDSLFTYNNLHLGLTMYNLINQLSDDFDNKEEVITSEENELKLRISDSAISALRKSLKDKSPLVREETVISLGKIGLPEAQNAIDDLIMMINLEQSLQIKAIAITTLSLLDIDGYTYPIIQLINKELNNITNIQSQQSILNLISSLGEECPDNIMDFVIENLLKTKVNKVFYAKTLLALGEKGENLLIKIFNKDEVKIKTSIAQAFANAHPSSSNFDFIIEALFKHHNHISALVRKNIMASLYALSRKNHNSPYLNNQKLLDYFYGKILDKDDQISKLSIEYITKLGPSGELILIEGLTKDPNPKVRLSCGIGLINKGVHNYIILLNALYDKDYTLTSKLQSLLFNSFYLCDIKNHYQFREQKDILLITINDILDNVSLIDQLKTFLKNIVKQLSS